MRKRLITALAATAFTVLGNLAMAAEHAAIVGAWNMQLDLQGQAFALDLVIAEAAGSLSGTVGSSEFGVSPISKVTFDGETLQFETPDQQGGTVQISLKLAADKLTGNIASAIGDIPATASRK